MSTPTIVERSPTPIPPRGSINDDCSDYSGSFLNKDCEVLLPNLNIDSEDDASGHTVRARKKSKSRQTQEDSTCGDCTVFFSAKGVPKPFFTSILVVPRNAVKYINY